MGTHEDDSEMHAGTRRDFLLRAGAGIAALGVGALAAESALANTLKPYKLPDGPLKVDPNGRFAGKCVLITGSTNGLGAATAIEFAREGAKVCVHGRSAPKANDVLEKIKSMGGEARFFPADVRRDSEVKKLVADANAAFGGIDIAVNSAAIFQTGIALADVTLDDWQSIVDTNITGVFLSMKYEIQAMLARKKSGVIVNICSTASHFGQIDAPAYTGTKHAVLGLTKAAAKSYAAQDIRINAISPAQFDHIMGTDKKLSDFPDAAKVWRTRSPAGRLLTVEEVARSVLWLASPEAAFMIGNSLVLDGGMMS